MERAGLIALGTPGSSIAEAYRNVRSVIHTAGPEMKVIEITNVVPNAEKALLQPTWLS